MEVTVCMIIDDFELNITVPLSFFRSESYFLLATVIPIKMSLFFLSVLFFSPLRHDTK